MRCFFIAVIIQAVTALIGVAVSAAIPAITGLWCVALCVGLLIIGTVVSFIFGLAGSRGKKKRK